MGRLDFFSLKDRASGMVQNMAASADAKLLQNPNYRVAKEHVSNGVGALYQPGDFSRRTFQKTYDIRTTEEARTIRKEALAKQDSDASVKAIERQLSKLIKARAEFQKIFNENYKHTQGYDDRAERGKHRTAAAGALSLVYQLWDSIPNPFGGKSECECEDVATQAFSWAVVKAAVMTGLAFKLFHEPSIKNYEKEQTDLKEIIKEYTAEIKMLIDDLRDANRQDVIDEFTSKFSLDEFVSESSSHALK